jgi:alkylhydroperoxidase/carboxymuconolactone decarboxylase family protein YurZ
MESSKPPLDPYGAAPKLRELRETLLFGDIWERKQLSKRDRSLITVAVSCVPTLVVHSRMESVAKSLAR